METLEIKVADSDKARRILKELSGRDEVSSAKLLAHSSKKPATPTVDEVTLVSEASLAEAWNSPEDDIWDDFYQELCTKKAI